MKAYTIADLDKAVQAYFKKHSGLARDCVEAALDAVVPVIVARAKAEALREAADLPDPAGHWTHACSPLARQVILARADEIERGAP